MVRVPHAAGCTDIIRAILLVYCRLGSRRVSRWVQYNRGGGGGFQYNRGGFSIMGEEGGFSIMGEEGGLQYNKGGGSSSIIGGGCPV